MVKYWRISTLLSNNSDLSRWRAYTYLGKKQLGYNFSEQTANKALKVIMLKIQSGCKSDLNSQYAALEYKSQEVAGMSYLLSALIFLL